MLYFKTFATVEEARAFMKTQRPSPETRARMDEYKAKFAYAKVGKTVTWRPDITYDEVAKEMGWS